MFQKTIPPCKIWLGIMVPGISLFFVLNFRGAFWKERRHRMHRFDRGPEPIDLSKHVGENWDSFSATEDHCMLGDALYARQDGYCAYCESYLPSKAEGHIEHLERRSECPKKTFDWNNLFFSCLRQNSCGKYKDDHKPKIRFDRKDIVDPSKEDPANFFTFTMTGIILPIDGPGKNRAKKTIELFNLNDVGLTQQRKHACVTIQSSNCLSESEISFLLESLREAHAPFLLMYTVMLRR